MQHIVIRCAAGKGFHRQTQAAEIVEGIVIIDQAIEIAGASHVGIFDLTENLSELRLNRAAKAVGAVTVAEATQVNIGQLAALLPGAGALYQSVDPGAIAAGGIAKYPQAGKLPGVAVAAPLCKQCTGILHPVGGELILLQIFPAVKGTGFFPLQGLEGVLQRQRQRRVVANNGIGTGFQGHQCGVIQ